MSDGVLAKYRVGGQWKRKVLAKGRGSQTPGRIKGPTCSLVPIAGLPRKYWISSRSYKHKSYHMWCAFSDGVNR